MLVLSHRGIGAPAPENTLEAFHHVASLGVDGIETDVRLAADGDLVLLHDRVLPDGRPVAALSRAEIERALGHGVPTVKEALDAFPALLWNLELKTPEVVPPLLAFLRSLHVLPRLLLTSFHHDLIKGLPPMQGVLRGVLVAHGLFATPRGVDAVVWDYETLDPQALRAAAAHAITSFAYGPHTRDEHERCRSLGLAGVITDHPALLL